MFSERKQAQAVNCRSKSASIGIIFREKKAQAQVENEKQCKAIRQHSADKKANKTDDKAIKLLSEISSFTTVPRMKSLVVKISLPLNWLQRTLSIATRNKELSFHFFLSSQNKENELHFNISSLVQPLRKLRLSTK